MNARPLTTIFAAYGTAIAVFALALFAGFSIGGRAGLEIARVIAIGCLILVTIATFRWGEQRGYKIVVPGKGLSVENLLRNLVMTACVVTILVILGSPVFGIVFQIAHPR